METKWQRQDREGLDMCRGEMMGLSAGGCWKAARQEQKNQRRRLWMWWPACPHMQVVFTREDDAEDRKGWKQNHKKKEICSTRKRRYGRVRIKMSESWGMPGREITMMSGRETMMSMKIISEREITKMKIRSGREMAMIVMKMSGRVISIMTRREVMKRNSRAGTALLSISGHWKEMTNDGAAPSARDVCFFYDVEEQNDVTALKVLNSSSLNQH